jgi:HSP20 family protein
VSVMHFDPFGDPFRGLDRLTSQLLSAARTPMAMPMDVWQSEDGYHVALDLPGVDPESVEITSERNVLTIRAGYGENDKVVVAERPYGEYTRQLQVGDALDSGNVAANYHNGVLHLTIPVSAAAQPRRIEVRRGGDDQPVSVGAGPAEAGRSAGGATAGARG